MSRFDDELDARARELLGGDGLTRLRRVFIRRLADSGTAGEQIMLRNITAGERSALERLLGCPGRFGAHATVGTAELEALLSPFGFSGLRDALERIDGPITSMRRERETAARAWNEARDWALSRIPARFCEKEAMNDAFAQGWMKRLAGGDPQRCRILIDETACILEALDCAGKEETDVDTRKNWSLAELAARLFGDSHALDAHNARTRFLRLVTGLREESDAEFWQALGVSCLATSSSVLLLNVSFASGKCAAAINAYAGIGEPFRLTLRALRDHPEAARVKEVSICENPAVLEAAADRLGRSCRPLICTEGQPSAACRNVLRSMDEAGARLRYHGDFDWGGLRIANGLFREFSTLTPWRYDYLEYARMTADSRRGFALRGHPVDAVWDPLLRARMEHEGRGHHEESALDDLLNDLVS